MLREMGDRHLLPYRHRVVTQVRVDCALTLLLEGDASVCIEQPASLSVGAVDTPGAEVRHLVPERQQVGAALELFGSRVLSSVAFTTGALRIVFDNGVHLDVASTEAYEAWSARGPGSMCVVSQPGGGLAVWK